MSSRNMLRNYSDIGTTDFDIIHDKKKFLKDAFNNFSILKPFI